MSEFSNGGEDPEFKRSTVDADKVISSYKEGYAFTLDPQTVVDVTVDYTGRTIPSEPTWVRNVELDSATEVQVSGYMMSKGAPVIATYELDSLDRRLLKDELTTPGASDKSSFDLQGIEEATLTREFVDKYNIAEKAGLAPEQVERVTLYTFLGKSDTAE